MADSVRDQIELLRRQLERHNRLYYVEAAPEITDREYDELMAGLQSLEAAHPEFDSPSSPSHKVGGEPIDGFLSVNHVVPMLSIDNAFEEQEIIDWDAGLKKSLERDALEYSVEFKIDGVALALIYEHGAVDPRRNSRQWARRGRHHIECACGGWRSVEAGVLRSSGRAGGPW